jgi:SAM-dependent methyltransferase
MSFAVPASAYDRFMGRYSSPLAPLFADYAGVEAGERVLDVGAGPGALTAELVSRVGAENVSAVDPSEPFVAALHERFPNVAAGQASAEELPFEDDGFDRTLAQLVVHFMADPIRGLREMARVTRTGGVVAASVWDHGGGHGPLSLYWELVREFDPGAGDESGLAGATEGHLTQLFEEAGIRDVEDVALTVYVTHETFEDWWEPYFLGVGPAGAYVAGLDDDAREALHARAAARFEAPFTIEARAWSARGRVT